MTLMEQINTLDNLLFLNESELKTVTEELLKREAEYNALVLERDDLVNLVALDTQASDVIKKIFDTVSTEGFKFLETMVNRMLQMVFVDENYQFKIKIGSRGSERTVEFLLNDGKSENPLSECGGGVQVTISFVFRAYYILRTKMRRFMGLDETLVQLSPQYLPMFMMFLQALVDEYGFDFLWISHNSALKGYSKKFYEIYKGKLTEER